MIETDDYGAAAADEGLAADDDFDDFDDGDGDGDAGEGFPDPGEAVAPDPYAIAVPDHLRETYAIDPDDTLTAWVRGYARSSRMAPEQFRKLTSGYVGVMVREANTQHAAEVAELEREWGGNCQKQLDGLTAWARSAAADEAEFEAVKRLATTAAGVRFLARLRDQGAGAYTGGSARMATSDGQGLEDQARALMRTAEYRRGDKAVCGKVRAIYQRLYPGKMVTAATEPRGMQPGQTIPEKRRGW